MNEKILGQQMIGGFYQHLYREEKAGATIEKYLRDVRGFACFAGNRPVTRELVIAYKRMLVDILGHSSIETTRIYIMTTGTEHRRKIERLGLVI